MSVPSFIIHKYIVESFSRKYLIKNKVCSMYNKSKWSYCELGIFSSSLPTFLYLGSCWPNTVATRRHIVANRRLQLAILTLAFHWVPRAMSIWVISKKFSTNSFFFLILSPFFRFFQFFESFHLLNARQNCPADSVQKHLAKDKN